VWADGIFFKLRLEPARACVLVVIGTARNGPKELLAIEDGGLGFWKALEEAFPQTHNQCCCVYNSANVQVSHIVKHDIHLSLIFVTAPDCLREAMHFLPSLRFLVMHPQQVFVDVIASKFMADTVTAAIRRVMSDGVMFWCPRSARPRIQRNGSELAEADHAQPIGWLIDRGP